MSTQTEKHKPKPYRIQDRRDGVTCIYAPSFNAVIAEFSSGTAKDAEIIGKQLNAHAALVDALKALLAAHDSYPALPGLGEPPHWTQARAALALAEEGSK